MKARAPEEKFQHTIHCGAQSVAAVESDAVHFYPVCANQHRINLIAYSQAATGFLPACVPSAQALTQGASLTQARRVCDSFWGGEAAASPAPSSMFVANGY
jgi:hypothetical protein